MINPDDHDLADFGVLHLGAWKYDGAPDGIEICEDIADNLPRFLLREPVIMLAPEPELSVYVRGLYSDRLTKERRAAYWKARWKARTALEGE